MSIASLADEYARQERWRRWDEALDRVPLRAGQRVLDLGCGVGAVTARLAQRGAEVIGVDRDEGLLAAARAGHPGVRFEQRDVTTLAKDTFGPIDGIWSSFVAAYLRELPAVLARWSACLVPGGWLGLVEMKDLLGHAPLAAPHVQDVQAFYADARRGGRYDFLAGARLADAARSAGLRVLSELVLPDDELSFAGPATPDVLAAWERRLARMPGLRQFLGTRSGAFERAFLAALASPEHRSACRVVMVVAERP